MRCTSPLVVLLTFRFICRNLLVDIKQMYFPIYHRFVHLIAKLPCISSDGHFIRDFAGMLAHVFGHFLDSHSSFKFHRYFNWLLFR